MCQILKIYAQLKHSKFFLAESGPILSLKMTLSRFKLVRFHKTVVFVVIEAQKIKHYNQQNPNPSLKILKCFNDIFVPVIYSFQRLRTAKKTTSKLTFSFFGETHADVREE